MRKRWLVTIPITLAILGIVYLAKLSLTPPKPVHIHAGFIVVRDNQQVNLTDTKYMLLRPCTVGKPEVRTGSRDIQLEKAHLHDNIGDVVHVEREGGTWEDLFTNIGYQIPYADATAYSNGSQDTAFPGRAIKPYESMVILIGQNASSSSFLAQPVSREHIAEVEKRSEYCGTE